MIEIINLTPHPMHVYPASTPDQIVDGSVTPLRVLSPSRQHGPARLGQTNQGTDDVEIGVPVQRVSFGLTSGAVDALPEPSENTWYVVSLVVGLAARHRHDLLVPYEYVRDMNGSIIGCRKFARPV